VLRIVSGTGTKHGSSTGLKLQSPFFHLHSHSVYSSNDALPQVAEMVATVKENGQPALALTDHGNMSGTVKLYKECNSQGIAAFPGTEIYFVQDKTNKTAKRYHLGLVALTQRGHEALVRLSTRSHENFYHKPILDWLDLAEWKERGWSDDILLMTGCFFGLVQQTLIHDSLHMAHVTLQRFAKLFPHTVVELQHHNIDHDGFTDDNLVDMLYRMAEEEGLPVVITQDAHYCKPEDKRDHETLKRVVAFGSDPDDALFPGDSFHLADTQWVKDHYNPVIWGSAMQTFRQLIDNYRVEIPHLDKYRPLIPNTTADPESELADLSKQKIWDLRLPTVYKERCDEELEVIGKTGMAGYLLVIKEITDWCRVNNVFFQTRGSAAASLICYLIGITQLDPIHYKLRFERFMSPDRTTPPDIDLDIEDTRRDELVEHLSRRFHVKQIGTWSTYSVNSKEGRGSLIVAFKKVAKAKGIDKETVDKISQIADIPEPEKSKLLALSDRNLYKSAGVHAAALVLTSSQDDFDSIAPTMYIASSKTTVTQYTYKDTEALGLLKVDLLGLKTLSMLRRIMTLLDRDMKDGLEWIPLSDRDTFNMIKAGKTEGIFQLEGWTAQRGCREIKVRSLKDIIVVMALYRPAVMSTGAKDAYIARREGREKAPERHRVITKALTETYGIVVFQDQVITMLRDLGMSAEDLTKVLGAIKFSNKNVAEATRIIAAAKDKVTDLAEQHHLSDDDFKFLWTSIEGFSEYGFNRSHATVYGVTAYRCAYLKCHHPLEFATGLLATHEGGEKEARYLKSVRDMGIQIGRPHVNVSGPSYSLDRERGLIRRGLISIPGIGIPTAEEIARNAPYATLDELIEKCVARRVTGGKSYAKHGTINGHLQKLAEAGALGDLYKG
jgi:DNA polymerase-3 subunit alpha